MLEHECLMQEPASSSDSLELFECVAVVVHSYYTYARIYKHGFYSMDKWYNGHAVDGKCYISYPIKTFETISFPLQCVRERLILKFHSLFTENSMKSELKKSN